MKKQKDHIIDTFSTIGLYWNQLWRQLKSQQKPALWDVPPEKAAAQDYNIFQSAFYAELPVLDLGCGSGLQTRFLAQCYSQVIGIDASRTAIGIAQKENRNPQVIFEQLNVLESSQVAAFHERFGDANIYMRGVIHQIPFENRLPFIHNMKRLMGESGSLYLIETAPTIQDYIQKLADRFSDLPLPFKSVLTSNLPPLGVSLAEIEDWFKIRDFDILQTGEASLATNIIQDNGQPINLPAVYALIKSKKMVF